MRLRADGDRAGERLLADIRDGNGLKTRNLTFLNSLLVRGRRVSLALVLIPR